jgi:glycosyltransferase involved in cell wall biosynthesis
LISAYGLVKAASAQPVRLLIVGDGDYRRPLLRHAAELGLTDVIFTGRVPHADVLGYYSLIDLFVVPRLPSEVTHLVTPLKPFEAFSTGRTVVLSNVRALAEIADQSGAAALFTAGDASSLAQTLLDLLDDPARRQLLAKTGADWVRSHRSWAANAASYRRIYADLGAMTRPDLD